MLLQQIGDAGHDTQDAHYEIQTDEAFRFHVWILTVLPTFQQRLAEESDSVILRMCAAPLDVQHQPIRREPLECGGSATALPRRKKFPQAKHRAS